MVNKREATNNTLNRIAISLTLGSIGPISTIFAALSDDLLVKLIFYPVAILGWGIAIQNCVKYKEYSVSQGLYSFSGVILVLLALFPGISLFSRIFWLVTGGFFAVYPILARYEYLPE
jgi:hypothetical protein